MKILILCQFSKGICGVWSRARLDAQNLAEEGNEVFIFSSNAIKGESGKAPAEDSIGNIKIKRYDFKKLGGESFMKWDNKWLDDAREFKPDLVMAHCYRHLHTTEALKVGCPVTLITHAPFVEDNRTRSFLSTLAVKFYDAFIGPRTINKFDKILAIAKWEVPYLKALGAEESRIEIQPNPIQKEFYSQALGKCKRDILFLGRVSPIKDIETLIRAAKLVPEFLFDIVGPLEEDYGLKLKALIKELNVDNVHFEEPVYDIEKKIEVIDNHKIFVLPSIREGLPTALIEALARKRICIASDNEGNKEVLEEKPNSFIFKIGDYEELAKLIRSAMK